MVVVRLLIDRLRRLGGINMNDSAGNQVDNRHHINRVTVLVIIRAHAFVQKQLHQAAFEVTMLVD